MIRHPFPETDSQYLNQIVVKTDRDRQAQSDKRIAKWLGRVQGITNKTVLPSKTDSSMCKSERYARIPLHLINHSRCEANIDPVFRMYVTLPSLTPLPYNLTLSISASLQEIWASEPVSHVRSDFDRHVCLQYDKLIVHATKTSLFRTTTKLPNRSKLRAKCLPAILPSLSPYAAPKRFSPSLCLDSLAPSLRTIISTVCRQ